MITVLQARKILGEMASKLTDEEIKQEIENVVFLADLALEFCPELLTIKKLQRKDQNG